MSDERMTENITKIQKFFMSMAQAIRNRMGQGLTFHVGESSAMEMCILASLDWPSEIKEADIAKGWLMCCSPDLESASDQHERNALRDRAAECAELAIIACHIVWSHDNRWNTLVDNLPACGSPSLGINAGSRDRARAAWLHMAETIGAMVYGMRPMIEILRAMSQENVSALFYMYKREYLRMGA